jgi:hypothetical protein
MSVYGAAPIALGIPAIAMTFGGAPAAADSGAPLPVAPAGVSSITQTATVAGNGGGGGSSPFDAALIMPVILADAAIAGMASPVAPQPATAAEAAPAEPASASPNTSNGSGTPPGLLVPPAAPPSNMIDEAPGRADDAVGVSLPATSGIQDIAQSVQNRTDGATDAIIDRIDAIDDLVAGLGDRIDAIDIGVDEVLSETLAGVVTTLDDRVASIDDALSGTVASANAQIAGLGEGLTSALADVDLGPVGGVDPAGGITTLVGMVSAADIFGLPDIGGGGDSFALPVLGSAGGDLLGDFAPADILLTVSDTHDGAFGLLAGLADDHSG